MSYKANAPKISEKSGNVIVEGRLLWNHLFEPRKRRDDAGEPKYEASIAIPASASMAALQEKMLEVATEAFPKLFKDSKGKWPASVKTPLKKTSEATQLGDIEDEFTFYVQLRSNAKNKPGVVLQNPKTPGTEDNFYPGCWVRASFDVFTYDREAKGISFGLKNVQLLADDEELSIGGASRVSPESEFEAVEGGDSNSLFD